MLRWIRGCITWHKLSNIWLSLRIVSFAGKGHSSRRRLMVAGPSGSSIGITSIIDLTMFSHPTIQWFLFNEGSVWYINIASVRTQFLISDFSQFFQWWRRGFTARNSKITNKDRDRDHAKIQKHYLSTRNLVKNSVCRTKWSMSSRLTTCVLSSLAGTSSEVFSMTVTLWTWAASRATPSSVKSIKW